MADPSTRYATTADGLSIAYQQFGGGDLVVLWVTGTASHVELFWELPGWAHAMRRLGGVARVIWFDKRGTGLSDRSLGSGTLEERMEDIRAVMDHAGVASAVVVGLSESGAMSALFAATYPERVERLVLVSSWAYDPDHTHRGGAFAELVKRHWGEGWLLESVWARGMKDTALLGRVERAMGTPSSMAALVRANATIDVRPVLPLVQVPALVVHCVNDPIIPIERGRELASLLPNAQLVEVDADFHGSSRPEEMDLYAQAIERFVVGEETMRRQVTDRVLSTVLFTDLVGSTEHAAAVGDSRWAELLDDHDRICRRAIAEARGRLVKMTGDGLLATFDGPASAISAAYRIIDAVQVLGLSARAGVHTGEVERRDADIGGVGVNLAARVMSAAGENEVWVSSTVPGLAVGADFRFEPRGAHKLKGIPDEWNLFVARREAAT